MKKNKTKQIILDKSLDLFSQNSFFNVSMQDLANALNIKKSLIYYYFESKSKLYQEAISQYFNDLINQFEIIFSKKLSASEKINILSELYMKELEKDQLILFKEYNKDQLDESTANLITSAQKNIISYFESIISEGIQQGEFKTSDPKKSSLTLVGYLEKIKQYNIKLDHNWFDFLIR